MKRQISEVSGLSEELGAAQVDADGVSYPYEVDDADHCETPLVAYQDISFFLHRVGNVLGKTMQELAIYDPYYCEGTMVGHMTQLGFGNVYNKKKDFYRAIRRGRVPEFDVLVTNPPYSGDNISRLLDFCLSCGKPFFLLMPHYVYDKDYFRANHPSNADGNIFFVVPKTRYLYTTPKGRRQQKSAKYTSPFPTFWYCSLGAMTGPHSFRDKLLGEALRGAVGSTCAVCPTIDCLPLDVLTDRDPRKKKYKNAQKRKKHKKRKKEASS